MFRWEIMPDGDSSPAAAAASRTLRFFRRAHGQMLHPPTESLSNQRAFIAAWKSEVHQMNVVMRAGLMNLSTN